MSYDPVPFWNAHALYLSPPGLSSPEHVVQEAALRAILAPLEWESVFEIGVGGGRITDLLHQLRPGARYTGLDVGWVQLANARRIWPSTPEWTPELICSPIEDFAPAGRQWDLVVVSEVLMHVVPERIADACTTLLAMARRDVVAVEWVPLPGELDGPVADWNFPHDYSSLLVPTRVVRVDRQWIMHVDRAPRPAPAT